MTPTQRALAHCRANGWTAQVVEKWIPHTKRRLDLFGFIDLVVLDNSFGPLGVQVTSGSNVAARITKALAEPRLRLWLEVGGRFQCWAWRQVVAYRKDGSKAKRKTWELRVEHVTAQSFEGAV